MYKNSKNVLNLPHLPVPSLHQTAHKYLKLILPFVNETELSKSEELMEKFVSEDCIKLQELLIKKAQNSDNWLSDWWYDRSLEFRKNIQLLSSLILLPFENFHSDSEWTQYAAKIIVATVHCHLDIINGKFPEERSGNRHLCMNQYKENFGTTRLPRKGKDILHHNKDSKHIIIVRRNNVFKLELLNSENEAVTVSQVSSILEEILQQSEIFAEPIGILPSDERESWAEAREELLQHTVNRQSLKEIENSLFLVALDESIPPEKGYSRLSTAGKYLLHGGGSKKNSANRWSDKTIQIVISRDGAIGVLFEHTNIDAQPAARIVEHIQNFNHHINTSTEASLNTKVEINSKKLKFLVSDSLEKYIKNSETNVDRFVELYQLEAFEIEYFGENFIKDQKLTPGSFIQVALQLTYYRMYGTPIPTYEPTHTRKYFLGRLDFLQSCSAETVTFTKVMLDSEKSFNEKFDALVNAITNHDQLKLEVQEGYGNNQHFNGLKNIGLENGLKLPEIFANPHFDFTSEPKFIASQVMLNCNGLLCFVPQRDDYWTCSYNIRSNCILFSLMTQSQYSLTHFVELLQESFKDMYDLLIEVKKS